MKKILALLLTVGMVLGLFAGCGNSNTTPAGTAAAANPTAAAAADSLDGTYDITVWVSEMAGVKELTEQQIKDFMEENPGIVINATIEGVTESESATQMITSVEDGADLFCFAQDQLAGAGRRPDQAWHQGCRGSHRAERQRRRCGRHHWLRYVVLSHDLR